MFTQNWFQISIPQFEAQTNLWEKPFFSLLLPNVHSELVSIPQSDKKSCSAWEKYHLIKIMSDWERYHLIKIMSDWERYHLIKIMSDWERYHLRKIMSDWEKYHPGKLFLSLPPTRCFYLKLIFNCKHFAADCWRYRNCKLMKICHKILRKWFTHCTQSVLIGHSVHIVNFFF